MSLDSRLGTRVTVVSDASSGHPVETSATAGSAVSGWADNIVGVVASGIGLVFTMATILLFTFYFAADAPRIERALLSRLTPHRQKVVGWIWDSAIEQTGGYFYSRMLLVIINGGLFFVAMMLVGMPLAYALPLSVFEGFVAEFIPAVGTYIGAAVPILLTLMVQGLAAALILLVWLLIYQQAENYWLSPKIRQERWRSMAVSPSALHSPAARSPVRWGRSWHCQSPLLSRLLSRTRARPMTLFTNPSTTRTTTTPKHFQQPKAPEATQHPTVPRRPPIDRGT